MAQPRPNEMPKIIALFACIAVVLIFAFYRLFGGNRPAETVTNASGVPAITTSAQPDAAGTGATTSAISGNIPSDAGIVVNAKPGQMRQFDPTLDAEPDGTYPTVIGNARPGAFAKFKEETQRPQAAVKPPGSGTGSTIASAGTTNPGRLDNFDNSQLRTQEVTPRIMVDNTPLQEITLDGVVTGNDGFAVLTIREPGQQNTTIPDQKRFVRLGDSVGNAKIVEITESGLKLSKTEGTWSVGDKRGVTRRGTLVASLPTSERASAPAMDAKLPLISTP